MKKVTNELVTLINDVTPLISFIFNQDGMIYPIEPISDELIRLNEMNAWDFLYEYFINNPNTDLEYEISKHAHEHKWIVFRGHIVEYENSTQIMCCCFNISEIKRKSSELESEKRLRSLMLELTRSIFIANSIEEIFDLSLISSIKVLEKSKYGSIMIKEKDMLKIVSYYGFTEDIMDFVLPCKDSFLSRNTNNKMDQFVKINKEQLGKRTNFDFKDKNQIVIQSTLTGPIYIEGELFGIINIDSLEDNAFSDSDVQMMEFIRNNIEVAITNHKLYQEKLVLARHDSLTSLYNRHYFEEQFEISRRKAHRYNESFFIVLFDINHFKSINDNYGHFVGDQVLKYVAQTLLSHQRDSDILARFGGDEFIGIIFNSSLDELNHKYTVLVDELKNSSIVVDNLHVTSSFSFGLAQYSKDGETLDDLVKVADAQMYKNKKFSRSRE